MDNYEEHRYSPGERAILRELRHLGRRLNVVTSSVQQAIEAKIAEDEQAVEGVATRVAASQAALEQAIEAAKDSGVEAAPLEAALESIKEHADAIDAAKGEEAPAEGVSGKVEEIKNGEAPAS